MTRAEQQGRFLLITDGWLAYNGLEQLGYAHQRVFPSVKGKETGAYLPMVHLIISNLQRWLMGTHQGAVLSRHLPASLNAFTLRCNRRFWRGPAFHRALGRILQAERWPEYDTLHSVAKGKAALGLTPTLPPNIQTKVGMDGDKVLPLQVGVT